METLGLDIPCKYWHKISCCQVVTVQISKHDILGEWFAWKNLTTIYQHFKNGKWQKVYLHKSKSLTTFFAKLQKWKIATFSQSHLCSAHFFPSPWAEVCLGEKTNAFFRQAISAPLGQFQASKIHITAQTCQSQRPHLDQCQSYLPLIGWQLWICPGRVLGPYANLVEAQRHQKTHFEA